MKRVFIPLAVVLLAIGCNKKEESPNEKSLIESASALSKIEATVEDNQKRAEELKKLAPATNEEIKSVFPENLNGMPRTNLSVGDFALLQMASGDAKYGSELKQIIVKITDGAGEGGSAAFSLMKIGLSADKESTSVDNMEKVTQIDNRRVSIKENKAGGEMASDVSFIEKDRYIITLEGKGFTGQELLESAKGLNFSGLK